MAKSDVKIRKFYGDSSKRSNKTWEQKRIKLERCANDFSQNPIIPTRHLRIDDPVPIFETFPRQQMAFDYLKACQQVSETYLVFFNHEKYSRLITLLGLKNN